jgi:ribose transport system permease protein
MAEVTTSSLKDSAGKRLATSVVRALFGIRHAETFWIALILVGLVAVFGSTAPGFLTVSNLTNIVLNASEMLILASGMTFLLIAGVIDLSISSIVVFASVVGAEVMVNLAGTPQQIALLQYPGLAPALTLGIAACIGSGLVLGLVNGLLIVGLKIPPFIATLGTLGIVLGLAQVLTGGLNVANVPVPLQDNFGIGSAFGIVPWPIIVAAVVVAVMWIVLSRTRFGLRTYAIGANPEAARRAGIPVERHIVLLFALMGTLCSIAAVIDVARFDTATVLPNSNLLLGAIAAVVIGGTSLYGGRGRMSGTIVGALIPTVLLNGYVILGIQPYWQNVSVGAVLILAVFIDLARRSRAAASA